jgi:hypothetical protein
MNVIGKVFSALNALVASLHGLADTVNTVNGELRHRVGLDGASTPALEHDNAEEQPALPSNGRKGKKAAAAE